MNDSVPPVAPIAGDEKPVPIPYIHSRWRGRSFRQPSDRRRMTEDGSMGPRSSRDSSHARNHPEEPAPGSGFASSAHGFGQSAPGFGVKPG